MVPAMSLTEAMETSRIHSIAGLTGARTAVVSMRLCRVPHHTISDVGLDRTRPGTATVHGEDMTIEPE
jgi:magnesium chelatase family protein